MASLTGFSLLNFDRLFLSANSSNSRLPMVVNSGARAAMNYSYTMGL
jgi:hypothetical protein